MRALSVVFLGLVLLSSTHLHARVWKSVGGKTLEADFVSADRLTVTLKAGEAAPEIHWLSDFCREDQIYIQQQEALQLGQASEQLSMSAKVSWDFLFTYGANPKTTPVLNVELATQGGSITRAGRAGDLQIDSFETDSPTPLPLSEKTCGLNGKLSKVDKPRHNPLPHGMYYLLQFIPDVEPVTRIHRLKGSYKIVTGDAHTIVVKKIAQAKEVVLSDPILKQLQLKMVLRRDEPDSSDNFRPGSQSFSLASSGLPGKILDVSWTDSAGYRYCAYSESSSYWQNDAVLDDGDEYRGCESCRFTLGPSIPRDLELRITVLTNLREERVPFDFADLEVPERPKSLPPRPQIHPLVEDSSALAESAAPRSANLHSKSNATEMVKRPKRRHRRAVTSVGRLHR